MSESEVVVHPIPPLYDANARVLILGSFPSVRSRAEGFFYGHPQNRFWQVMARVLAEPVPETVAQKRAMLLSHGVALWDVIASCKITGSADGSIRSVVPNSFAPILQTADIRQIFVNGRTAERYYRRYAEPVLGRRAIFLPSTSPANAAFDADRLFEAWRVVGTYL